MSYVGSKPLVALKRCMIVTTGHGQHLGCGFLLLGRPFQHDCIC